MERMKDLPIFLLAAAIMITVAPRTSAQNAASQTVTTSHVVTSSIGFGPAGAMISAKPHAPFSAVLATQSEQALNDGTNISRDNREVVMRDGEGRIYRARKIKRPGSSEDARGTMFTITDPVLHLQYLCSPLRKTCTKIEYRPPSIRRPRAPATEKMRDLTVEDLGPSNISGLDVEGKRVTRVIPEGLIGNDRPLTTIEELWHSKELDVDVQVRRSDPRMGTRTTTMTEVSLGEPDPTYFQIPAGYRVEERKPPYGALAPLPGSPEPEFPPVAPNH